jgi:hypothetical protein
MPAHGPASSVIAHDFAPMDALAAGNQVAWLPADLRSAAARLLGEGKRLAQEWVGLQLLECDLSSGRLERGWTKTVLPLAGMGWA